MSNLTLKKIFYSLPVVAIALLTVFVFSGQMKLWIQKSNSFLGIVGFLLFSLFYIVVYWQHVSKNKKVENKTAWYAGFVLAWGIAITAYFFTHILKEEK